jgi:hypothetical protein
MTLSAMTRTSGSPLRSLVAAAVVVGILCLAATAAYIFQRPQSVQSTAQLVLVPAGTSPDARLQRLQTFSNSGVAGTFVEYLNAIGSAVPGSLTARAVPDSRVIDLRFERESGARRGLQQLLVTALAGQASIVDDWEARTLRQPSADSPAGPSDPMLFVAGALLALLMALATLTGLRALTRQAPPSPPAGTAAAAADPAHRPVAAPFAEHEEPRLVQRG